MTVARRSFTFASLALALVPARARAGAPSQAANPPAEPLPAPAEPALRAEWSLRRQGDELRAELVLVNRSDTPIDVLVARGSRPGPRVDAALQVDGELVALQERFEVDKREMLSRMGPIPHYEPVAAGGKLRVAEWRFALPADVQPEPVRLVAEIWTLGEPLTVVQEGLRWDTRAGS